MSKKSISFDEFCHALDRLAYLNAMLNSFNSKEEAIQFMMKETDISYEECLQAYDFNIHMFEIK